MIKMWRLTQNENVFFESQLGGSRAIKIRNLLENEHKTAVRTLAGHVGRIPY